MSSKIQAINAKFKRLRKLVRRIPPSELQETLLDELDTLQTKVNRREGSMTPVEGRECIDVSERFMEPVLYKKNGYKSTLTVNPVSGRVSLKVGADSDYERAQQLVAFVEDVVMKFNDFKSTTYRGAFDKREPNGQIRITLYAGNGDHVTINNT